MKENVHMYFSINSVTNKNNHVSFNLGQISFLFSLMLPEYIASVYDTWDIYNFDANFDFDRKTFNYKKRDFMKDNVLYYQLCNKQK